MELEEHLIKEEEEISPLIVEYSQTKSDKDSAQRLAGILELQDEHDTAGDIIKELREITDDYQLPEDAFDILPACSYRHERGFLKETFTETLFCIMQ